MLNTEVGFIGGDEKYKSPTYRQVCSGTGGFAEACKVEFDPTRVGYAELVGELDGSRLVVLLLVREELTRTFRFIASEFFYRTHDPTTVDRQGNDRGPRESYIASLNIYWL